MMIDFQKATIASTIILAVAVVAPIAQAGNVGVRIYVDPWNPQHPGDDSFTTYYDDPTVISGNVTDAWESSRNDAAVDVQNYLKEHDIGGGFRTYDVNVVLNPISGFAIGPSHGGGAIVTFTVPKISFTSSFRTPGPAPNGLDPRFTVTGNLVVSVDLEFGGNGQILSTAYVSAVVRDVKGPDALNASAQAIEDLADIFNAMAKFVTGIDFEQALIATLTSQDFTKKRFQPLIDANLRELNSKFQSIPNIDLLLARRVWADSNRLTLYVAPKPIPDVPRTGTMTGKVSWKASDVSGSCSAVKITASVQLGPPPLLRSDGVNFGPAPVVATGSFSISKLGLSVCAYTLAGLGTGIPNALQASTSLSAANAHGSTSQYVGQLHTTTTILPEGWTGDYVTPNATNRNYVVISSLTAGGGVGALQSQQPMKVPDPGSQENTQAGVTNQFNQSSAAVLAQQPGSSAQTSQAGSSMVTGLAGLSSLFNQPSATATQLGTRSATVTAPAIGMTTESYSSNGSGSGAQGFSLPPGAYIFEYVNQKGETKKFHAKVDLTNGGFAVQWGKKDVFGTIVQNRFTSSQTRADGAPILEGTLTANGAMSGRYMAEANGNVYAANFTLVKQ